MVSLCKVLSFFLPLNLSFTAENEANIDYFFFSCLSRKLVLFSSMYRTELQHQHFSPRKVCNSFVGVIIANCILYLRVDWN